jgi:isoprenylcysteine carboxyl methyltransferase (ICMT) family protein YpbQ
MMYTGFGETNVSTLNVLHTTFVLTVNARVVIRPKKAIQFSNFLVNEFFMDE